MDNTEKKPKSFPIVLVVVVLFILFVLAFLGAFGYSFVKTRVMKLASNNLQGLGSGKVGGLTGLEGLAGLVANASPENNQTGDSTTVSDNNDDLKICTKGTFFETSEGKATVTGKENITFEGKSADVCCYELITNTDEGIGTTTKTCMFVNEQNNTIVYKKTDGKYVIWGAVITENGKQCNYLYGDDGTLESKTCF